MEGLIGLQGTVDAVVNGDAIDVFGGNTSVGVRRALAMLLTAVSTRNEVTRPRPVS